MIKVESIGSFYWIDEENHRYSRTPKEERPRDYPENCAGTPLEDLKWFDFTHWELLPLEKNNFWVRKFGKLVVGVVRIHYEEGPIRRTPIGTGRFVHAPIEATEYRRLNVEYD